ncbi:hypothetical protein C2S52_006898 [Perilla frutescens var. hirtella]|nr:hypothetical protein C2S52_006898 [Perilla frutescens var. hirtella]
MGFDLNLSPPYVDDSFDKPEGSASRDEADPQSEDADEHCLDGETEIFRAIKRSLEPGSLMEDIDEAYVLYCEYARCQLDNKRSNSCLGVYKKQVTRTNCKARLHLLRPRDGPWSVSVFEKRESGGRQNVGFTRTDAYIHLGRKKAEMNVENGDSNTSNKMMRGKLLNFFFHDSRCAVDYEYFGDVVSFDTTYKTNKYNMVCAPFIGVNHHFHNVMFGLAFLSDETTETFEWLFGAFLEAMYGKEPEVIFSDQCQALMNGVDYTFETAAHRLCQWHINQNAPAHFGSLNGNVEFKKLWNCCMNVCETKDEFEEVWKQLIETSEVTNRILKDLGKRSNTLYGFVVRYCQVQNEWRERENAEDALCRGMPGQFLLDNPLLTHVAKVFTRNIFKIFEYEAHHSMNIKIIEHPDYASEVLFFGLSSGPQSDVTRSVAFNKRSHEVSCSCRMWELKVVFCRHIFKVLYLMNVDVIPERYILRRWTRDCKRRIIPDVKNPLKNVDDNLSGLVLVNSIMRLSYDMAYEAKGDAGSRSRVHKCMWKLRHQLLKDRELESKSRQKTGGDGTGDAKQMRNLSIVKTRTKSVRRKWRNSRLKGNRGDLLFHMCNQMMFFSEGCGLGELESTIISKLDFEHWNQNWIVGDLENNRQCLRLVKDEVNLETGLNLSFSAYLEKLAEWEDHFHQFNYLISWPDVFYYSHRNIVEASDEAWTEIGRIWPELLVYRPKGEPCWDQLRVLFRDVIVLSESQSEEEQEKKPLSLPWIFIAWVFDIN